MSVGNLAEETDAVSEGLSFASVAQCIGKSVRCYFADIKEGAVDVNLIFKIAAVGIIVSVIGQVLRQSGREEQAYLATLAGLVLVLFWIVPYISELFESIRIMFSM